MTHISSIGAGIFSRLLVNVHPIGTQLSNNDGTFGHADIKDYPVSVSSRTGQLTSANATLGEYFTRLQEPGSAIDVDGSDVKPRTARGVVQSANSNAGRWGSYTYIPNMREAPSFGVPPSLVNVPEFGSTNSKQVQGQADPTNIELAINYVPSYWTGDSLGGLQDGKDRLMAIVLANADPEGDYGLAGLAALGATTATDTDTIVGWTASGGGAVQHNIQNSIVFFVGELSALQFTPNLADANQATLTIALKSSFSETRTFGGRNPANTADAAPSATNRRLS